MPDDDSQYDDQPDDYQDDYPDDYSQDDDYQEYFWDDYFQYDDFQDSYFEYYDFQQDDYGASGEQQINSSTASAAQQEYDFDIPDSQQKVYDNLSESDKKTFDDEYPRVYIKNGTLEYIPEDTYWMAKTIYFEAGDTRYKDARQYVGWTVRNREEDGGYGTTYEDVVTSDSQYSSGVRGGDEALIDKIGSNEGEWKAWTQSVDTAQNVIDAPESDNPIPDVENFYSPISMDPPYSSPRWVSGMDEVGLPINACYFTFLRKRRR